MLTALIFTRCALINTINQSRSAGSPSMSTNSLPLQHSDSRISVSTTGDLIRMKDVKLNLAESMDDVIAEEEN